MPDWKIAKIVHSGATSQELRAALAWAEGGEEALSGMDAARSLRITYLYEILTASEDVGE